ncbi:mitochondrial export translocase [Teratosphaeria destructans]|uniref:Mitochondrial export translocase n=1 Tax=Teratosphaeria destructans TaxID=418781 RepID=A0A9W7SW80_9PEZI|nr:mitochondrial export translocase [Teratosphaeria destructans]
MASIMLACRPARASLLSLPPHLRLHAYQHSPPRHFSASAPAPHQSALVDSAVAPFTTLLDALHATGLPWCAVIPLAAVVARGIIALLLPVNNTRIIQLRSSDEMWEARQVDEEVRQKAGHSLPARVKTAFWINFRLWRMKRATLHELGSMFGAPYWHWRGGVGFGMLIAMTEAIRIKAGAREGLLPLILHPLQYLFDGFKAFWNHFRHPNGSELPSSTPGSAPLTSPSQPTPHEAISEWPPQTPTPDQLASSDPTLSSAAEAAQSTIGESASTAIDQTSQLLPSSRHFDPTMQTEGLPWCLDLTQPDPTFALPIMLSAYMVWNVIANARANHRLKRNPSQESPNPTTEDDAALSRLTSKLHANLPAPLRWCLSKVYNLETRKLAMIPPLNRWQLVKLTFSYLFFFVAIKIPAGILVYMLTSQLIGRLQGKWLDRRMPIRRGVQPCRRPLRLRTRGPWE